jgi:CubicO group peptidase (beta-lactamase class C family)
VLSRPSVTLMTSDHLTPAQKAVSGVYGTGWYNDPAEDMTTILMIQRAPAPPSLPILLDFWTAAYQAIDDRPRRRPRHRPPWRAASPGKTQTGEAGKGGRCALPWP